MMLCVDSTVAKVPVQSSTCVTSRPTTPRYSYGSHHRADGVGCGELHNVGGTDPHDQTAALLFTQEVPPNSE
jgi:hypothetical protein